MACEDKGTQHASATDALSQDSTGEVTDGPYSLEAESEGGSYKCRSRLSPWHLRVRAFDVIIGVLHGFHGVDERLPIPRVDQNIRQRQAHRCSYHQKVKRLFALLTDTVQKEVDVPTTPSIYRAIATLCNVL